MAHYALLNENNTVINVITGVDENITQIDSDGNEVGGSTQAWETFYAGLPWLNAKSCKRTSYNGTFRANFAGIGFTYDEPFDAFIPPKPSNSWKLNYQTFLWEPPITKPADVEGFIWKWSEPNQEWIKVTAPQATIV
jgi:hypothetical protein